MRLVYAPAAQRDLAAISDFIAIENRKRARSFVAELRAACRSLGTESLRYPVLMPGLDVRRMPVGNYLVLYRVGDNSVQIVRVLHSARDMRDLDL